MPEDVGGTQVGDPGPVWDSGAGAGARRKMRESAGDVRSTSALPDWRPPLGPPRPMRKRPTAQASRSNRYFDLAPVPTARPAAHESRSNPCVRPLLKTAPSFDRERARSGAARPPSRSTHPLLATSSATFGCGRSSAPEPLFSKPNLVPLRNHFSANPTWFRCGTTFSQRDSVPLRNSETALLKSATQTRVGWQKRLRSRCRFRLRKVEMRRQAFHGLGANAADPGQIFG